MFVQITAIELGGERGCSFRGVTIDSSLCKSDADLTLQIGESLAITMQFTPDCTTFLVQQGEARCPRPLPVPCCNSLNRVVLPSCVPDLLLRTSKGDVTIKIEAILPQQLGPMCSARRHVRLVDVESKLSRCVFVC